MPSLHPSLKSGIENLKPEDIHPILWRFGFKPNYNYVSAQFDEEIQAKRPQLISEKALVIPEQFTRGCRPGGGGCHRRPHSEHQGPRHHFGNGPRHHHHGLGERGRCRHHHPASGNAGEGEQ